MRVIKFALTMVCAVAGLVFFAAQWAGASEGIPLKALAGNYSFTCQGSLAVCLNPGTGGPVDCPTFSGPLVEPLTYLGVGALTRDANGHSCSTFIDGTSSLPVGKTPPSVSLVQASPGTTSNYDPATGTGDISFTGYSGGKCNGSTFDSSSATETGTSAGHFAASNGGKRFDLVFTSVIDFATGPGTNFIGGFSLSCTSLRQ